MGESESNVEEAAKAFPMQLMTIIHRDRYTFDQLNYCDETVLCYRI